MGKGEETRERILEHALKQASLAGLEGLTVGSLASELGLSKSGLFAHFGSKDSLQVQVLQEATALFEQQVIRPALKEPRGEPRVRALFDYWLTWGHRNSATPGGCIFVAASVELDDKPGPARDFLVAAQKQSIAALSKAARIAIEVGHFRADLDPDQFAFQFYALILGFHHVSRLLHDPKAEERVRAAFEQLLAQSRV
jgi:AcrR family transcriptional regulator